MIDKVCAKCGTRLSYFMNTGYLGCPNCYSAFRDELNSAILKIQGSNVHVGKTPSITGLDKELLDEYRRLIAEKEKAGIEKRFKDMAELTLSISELAEELKRRRLL